MKQRCFQCGATFDGYTCVGCKKFVDVKDLRLSPLDYLRLVPIFVELGLHARGSRRRALASARARDATRAGREPAGGEGQFPNRGPSGPRWQE